MYTVCTLFARRMEGTRAGAGWTEVATWRDCTWAARSFHMYVMHLFSKCMQLSRVKICNRQGLIRAVASRLPIAHKQARAAFPQ